MQSLKKIFLICIGICAIFTLLIIFSFIITKKDKNNANELNIKKYVQVIKNREIVNVSECIYIGNNKKEIENGYYDIKIEENLGLLKLTINCLRKNVGSEILDSEYALEVCYYISLTFNKKINAELLKDKLSESYLSLRKNYNESDLEIVRYNDGIYNVLLYESGNELCLEVGK